MYHCEETKGCKNACFSNCLECGVVVNYSTRMNYNTAKKRSKNFGLCPSCLKKGDRNPFFNKRHSKESMEKMIETSKNSEARKKYYEKIHSVEFREMLSLKMKENPPMKGKSYYSIWVEKYGVQVADKMNKETSLKKSVKGEKNYWFGKTPPYGSGNGWSGWYKSWYFRSLLELSYMVTIIEKNNIKWESGETSKYKITYEHSGETKNYFPDFILNEKYMIECKPKNLWKTDKVNIKSVAAKKFCDKNGLIYKIRTVPILSDEEIISLYLRGDLVWIERYKNKFEERVIKFYD